MNGPHWIVLPGGLPQPTNTSDAMATTISPAWEDFTWTSHFIFKISPCCESESKTSGCKIQNWQLLKMSVAPRKQPQIVQVLLLESILKRHAFCMPHQENETIVLELVLTIKDTSSDFKCKCLLEDQIFHPWQTKHSSGRFKPLQVNYMFRHRTSYVRTSASAFWNPMFCCR